MIILAITSGRPNMRHGRVKNGGRLGDKCGLVLEIFTTKAWFSDDPILFWTIFFKISLFISLVHRFDLIFSGFTSLLDIFHRLGSRR